MTETRGVPEQTPRNVEKQRDHVPYDNKKPKHTTADTSAIAAKDKKFVRDKLKATRDALKVWIKKRMYKGKHRHSELSDPKSAHDIVPGIETSNRKDKGRHNPSELSEPRSVDQILQKLHNEDQSVAKAPTTETATHYPGHEPQHRGHAPHTERPPEQSEHKAAPAAQLEYKYPEPGNLDLAGNAATTESSGDANTQAVTPEPDRPHVSAEGEPTNSTHAATKADTHRDRTTTPARETNPEQPAEENPRVHTKEETEKARELAVSSFNNFIKDEIIVEINDQFHLTQRSKLSKMMDKTEIKMAGGLEPVLIAYEKAYQDRARVLLGNEIQFEEIGQALDETIRNNPDEIMERLQAEENEKLKVNARNLLAEALRQGLGKTPDGNTPASMQKIEDKITSDYDIFKSYYEPENRYSDVEPFFYNAGADRWGARQSTLRKVLLETGKYRPK